MIGKLTGVIVGNYNNIVIIDVLYDDCAIGYEVIMKQADISTLNQGEKVTIFIKEIIKEDDDSLYGFLSFEDRCWFEEFIKISSLGPKTALAILSAYTCESITEAIMVNNCDFFSSISGIGGKLANRIPVEMKKQVEKITERVMNFGIFDKKDYTLSNPKTKIKDTKNNVQKSLIDYDNTENNQQKKQKSSVLNDAISALSALGFTKQNIYEDVFKIVKSNANLSTEDIVKEFLRKKDNR